MSAEMLNERTWTSPQVRQAFPSRTGTMTVSGVVGKSLVLLAIVLLLAGWGWSVAPEFLAVTNSWWFLIGYVLLIVMTVWVVRDPRLAAGIGVVFAIINGLWVGAVSRMYESWYDGVVAKALLGTIAVTLAVLLLFLFVPFRATSRFVQIVSSLTVGIGLFYLIVWILSFFGGDTSVLYGASPISTLLSLFFMAVAAANLVIDFTQIERGVAVGAPKGMEWYSALGLVSTVVWLYMEILRFLANRARQSG